MNELSQEEKEESIKRIREICKGLIEVNDLKINKIADYLGLEKQQHWYFYKFISEGIFPNYLESSIGKILEDLRKLEENPNLINLNSTGSKEDHKGYDISKPFLVWVPFDLKLPVTDDFNFTIPLLSVIQIGIQKGIIIYRNTSKYNADGELFVGQTGMASDIEPGTRIAIKRINKTDWKTDRYYVIVDASEEISICELLPGDDEKTVKFVSTKSPEGPHKIFPLERILAIFKIVDGNWIPTPTRNRIVIPNLQQQDKDQPSADSPTS